MRSSTGSATVLGPIDDLSCQEHGDVLQDVEVIEDTDAAAAALDPVRAAFADDLTAAVLDLAARHHHDGGRPHRLVIAAHPVPEERT